MTDYDCVSFYRWMEKYNQQMQKKPTSRLQYVDDYV